MIHPNDFAAKPEGNWGWRRLYTFALTFALIWAHVEKGSDAAIYAAIAIAFTYLVTPAVQAWISAITIWRGAKD